VIEGGPISDLQAFIDERWAVAQPRFYPDFVEGPRVPSEVTPSEAGYFLAAVAARGPELPLFKIDDERKQRSDRIPPIADGTPRGYHFFEAPARLRLETIVHMAAMARLHLEFGWPREHLIYESPTVTRNGTDVVHHDALDILLLEAPCAELAAKMPITAARPRIGVEAKARAEQLGKLLDGMQACQPSRVTHHKSDHAKCLAIEELQPRLFLGIAANTWRLFTVVERNRRSVLGDELPDLKNLHFSPTTRRS
jgi:hypothetical protein